MPKLLKHQLVRGFGIVAIVFLFLATSACGQESRPLQEPVSKTKTPSRSAKTIFFDSDGNEISNNEFVDIRMANFHSKDATKMAVLADGTTEFRLQKVPQEGTIAPAFTVTTIDGRTFSTADLKGKVLVLNFWFIGCPGCLEEMPKLNNFVDKFGSNGNILFIAVTFDPKSKLKTFLAREKFDYQMVADAQVTLDSFAFSGYPKNIVIGKDGKIVYWRSTISAWDKFNSVIQAELDKN